MCSALIRFARRPPESCSTQVAPCVMLGSNRAAHQKPRVILKVLGTPTLEEIQAMNQNYTEYKFPQVKPHPWSKVFRPRTPPEAIELVSKFLRYAPDTRLKPLEGCAMPFFDELREQNLTLPNGRAPPSLFDFKPQELFEHPPSIKGKLIPDWHRTQTQR